MDAQELKRRFGLRVQTLRRQRDLTQEQLAEAIGKSTDTVSNIETGRLSTRIETAMNLAEALDVSLSDLFDVSDKGRVTDREHRKAIEQHIRVISPLSTEQIQNATKLVRVALELGVRSA